MDIPKWDNDDIRGFPCFQDVSDTPLPLVVLRIG